MPRIQITTSPKSHLDGEFVSFNEDDGLLTIEGYEGMTTLSKENAKELAKVLAEWAEK